MKKLKKNAFVILTSILLVFSVLFAGFVSISVGTTGNVDRTKVGYIGFAGKDTAVKVKKYLIGQVTEWQSSLNYTVEYQGYTMKIDQNLFTFDVETTYAEAIRKPDYDNGNDAIFYVSAENKAALKEDLIEAFTASVITDTLEESLINDMLEEMKGLNRIYNIDLYSYVNDAQSQYAIDEFLLRDVESDIVNKLDGITLTIGGSKRFSLIETFANMAEKYTNEELSVVATGLAQIVQKTSFTAINKRQNQGEKISYANATDILVYIVGRKNNATSSADTYEYDFTFQNVEKYDFKVEITKRSSNEINFVLIGHRYLDTFTVTREVIDIPFTKVETENDAIATAYKAGATEFEGHPIIVEDYGNTLVLKIVLQEGVNGQQVIYYRTRLDKDGKDTGEKIGVFSFPEVIDQVQYVYEYAEITK